MYWMEERVEETILQYEWILLNSYGQSCQNSSWWPILLAFQLIKPLKQYEDVNLSTISVQGYREYISFSNLAEKG